MKTIILCLLLCCCKATEPQPEHYVLFYNGQVTLADPELCKSMDLVEYQEITKEEFLVLIQRSIKQWEYKVTEFEKQ